MTINIFLTSIFLLINLIFVYLTLRQVWFELGFCFDCFEENDIFEKFENNIFNKLKNIIKALRFYKIIL